ncbi:carbohydrate kinase family protein [Diaminobutyricimonas sp. LJ205]|uniref:carbohydrate kinase family protein n=1 Tax=Diaminobutyricimonas sp. LJ205 TaxID=2683590 RepID=UPI0012F5078F|nr:PfkB family carbohydrate kinase [Diaminobutyricimonas sp. LJ205]
MTEHIVICGPVSWNHMVYLDRLPEPRPHMQFALEDFQTVGGTSAGKALHLAGLGHRVVCMTVVGDDEMSTSVRDTLTGAGVELAASVVPGPAERHLNLMTRTGERVSLYLSTPSPAPVDERRFAEVSIGAAAIVMDLSEASRALLPAAVAAGAPLWTDIHDYDGSAEFHAPFIEAASYVFMNADRLPDPHDFMRSRVEAGATAVICTLGARGAIAYDRDGFHQVDAVDTEVVDTNGAGDGFLAGYLDATLRGGGTDEALRAAAAQAAVALGTRHLHPVLET